MRAARRTLIGAALAGAAAALAGCGAGRPPTASWHGPRVRTGSTIRERPATPEGLEFTQGRLIEPAAVPTGYAPKVRETLARYLQPTAEIPKHPGYAGAVALAVVDGIGTVFEAVGDALRYGTGSVELSPSRRVPMRLDSVFDLASLTKVFTALLVLKQVEAGRIALDTPVSRYLPEFKGTGKSTITPAMLLAHTSGLPTGISLSARSTPAAQRTAILSAPLLRGETPGATFRYSGLGLLVLAALLEKVTGLRLDPLLRAEITGPLGLRDTGFRPLTWLSEEDQATRLVATDARRPRGLLRGVVHDDIASAMGGIAGHAGLFGTATDMAVVGQMLVNGGEYAGRRILTEATVRRMLVNANPGLPAVDPDRPGRSSTHGLGVELDQPWFMGRLASPLTFGHTGFTGTSLVVDPHRRVVLVLLSNRAHPNWTWANADPPRVAVANTLAEALGI